MKKSLFAVLLLVGCERLNNPISPENDISNPRLNKSESRTYDGPFGLTMGIPVSVLLADLEFKNMPGQSHYFLGKPPKAIPNLSMYRVTASENVGVCEIIATKEMKNVNGRGDQLKGEVNILTEMLSEKYGQYTEKDDSIKDDVFRKIPNDWMIGLKQNSVSYGYGWKSAQMKKPLPNNIFEINVFTMAHSNNDGWVTISYKFNNFKICQNEMTKKVVNSL